MSVGRIAKRASWVIAWCCAPLVLACAGTPEAPKAPPYVEPAEHWKFDFDGRVWMPGPKTRDKVSATETFLLPGQTDKTWTELVSTGLTFGAQRSTTVMAIAEASKKTLEKDCPDFKWDYLERAERSLVYEWSRSKCKDKNIYPQHEVTRLSAGRLGIHKLTYTVKAPQMSPGLRRQWLKLLGEATLELREPSSGQSAPSAGAVSGSRAP